MPYTRPTLSQLRQQGRGFFQIWLPGADMTLRRSVLGVIADVLAGFIHGLYGFLDWLAKQVFASSADIDALVRQGAEYGLAPLAGTNAAGNIVVSGIASETVPDGTGLQSTGGWPFVTVGGATVGGGGTVTVAVEATEPGANGNLASGAPLTFVTAIAGINAVANVDSGGLSGGTDTENTEAFRARVLARKRQPPQGGVAYDYEAWAKTVAGVTRAWCVPRNRGAGTVDVSFVMDGRSNIIPLSADVADVQAAVDAKRPVTDDCIVFAPTPSAVNFTITGVDASAQAGITAALKALFANLELAQGLSLQDEIIPAVAGGAGTSPFDVTVPSADVGGAAGTLLTLGTISWS